MESHTRDTQLKQIAISESCTLLVFLSFKQILAFIGFCSTLAFCFEVLPCKQSSVGLPFWGPEMKLSRYMRFGKFQKKSTIFMGMHRMKWAWVLFMPIFFFVHVFHACTKDFFGIFVVVGVLLLSFPSPQMTPFLLIFRNWNVSPSKVQNKAMIFFS